MYKNLRCVCRNYAALGVRRFLVARAIEGDAQLALCREIIPAASTMVCRLIAGTEVMSRRVAARETGISRQECIARVATLHAILDSVRLEDFVMVNEKRLLHEVALEIVLRMQWIAN
jgi:hypothetical protein